MFKVGDRVIYPHHGAAKIVGKSRRKEFDEECEYFHLETIHDQLSLSVPVDKVDDVGMREPIDQEDVEDLFELLSKKGVREPPNWSRRFKNHQEKLKSGDIYQVAEVVRNLSLRNANKGLSAGERSMLEKSRLILTSELSISLKISEAQAAERVDQALE